MGVLCIFSIGFSSNIHFVFSSLCWVLILSTMPQRCDCGIGEPTARCFCTRNSLHSWDQPCHSWSYFSLLKKKKKTPEQFLKHLFADFSSFDVVPVCRSDDFSTCFTLPVIRSTLLVCLHCPPVLPQNHLFSSYPILLQLGEYLEFLACQWHPFILHASQNSPEIYLALFIFWHLFESKRRKRIKVHAHSVKL